MPNTLTSQKTSESPYSASSRHFDLLFCLLVENLGFTVHFVFMLIFLNFCGNQLWPVAFSSPPFCPSQGLRDWSPFSLGTSLLKHAQWSSPKSRQARRQRSQRELEMTLTSLGFLIKSITFLLKQYRYVNELSVDWIHLFFSYWNKCLKNSFIHWSA